MGSTEYYHQLVSHAFPAKLVHILLKTDLRNWCTLDKKKRVTRRSLCSSLTYTDDLVVIYSSSSGICPWGIQFRPFSCHLANPPIGDVSSRLWHLVVGAKLAAPDSNRYPVRLLFLLAATHADKQHHRRHHHPSSSKPLLTSYQFKVKVGFFFWSLVYW